MNARVRPMGVKLVPAWLVAAAWLPLSVWAAPGVSVTDTALTFTEGGGAMVIDAALTATGPAGITAAAVQIVSGYTAPEDVLGGGDTAAVDTVWNAGPGQLVLVPAAPATTVTEAEMQAALRTVTYKNTNIYDPSAAARTVRFAVYESGTTDPATDNATVNLTTVNDAPQNTVVPAIVFNGPPTDPPNLQLTSAGTWDDDETATGNLTLTYQWQRSNDGTTYANLTGQTGATYELDLATDINKYFRCRVTARDDNATPLSTTASSNALRPLPDPDGDGLPTPSEDYDGDGVLDAGETNPNVADTDGDGLNDGLERNYGTDPRATDTDGDALSDYQEDENHNGQHDAATEPDALNEDTDGDGLLDGQEDRDKNGSLAAATVTPRETDPLDADTDDDGLTDGQEDRNADGTVDPDETNPRVADGDSDGLLDGQEDLNGNGILEFGESDPDMADTDSDGLRDDKEQSRGEDLDADGYSNAQDADSDGDGLDDAVEDADKDGVVDATETSPILADTDGDGMPDGWETQNGLDPLDPADGAEDLDSGGLSNLNEYRQKRDPNNRLDDFLPTDGEDTRARVAYAEKVGDVADGTRTIEMTRLEYSSYGTHVFAGNFSPSAAFGGLALTAHETYPDRSCNAFVAARDDDMEWIWAMRLVGTNGITIWDVTVFGDYVYVVGSYSGRLYYQGVELSTAYWSSANGFCLRLRATDGLRLQSLVKRYCMFEGVAANDHGLYLCGNYYTQALAIGTWTARSPEETGDVSGDIDIFVCRLRPELDVCDWGNSGGGGKTANNDDAYDIKLDGDGNAYIAGTIHGYKYATKVKHHRSGPEGDYYTVSVESKPATFQNDSVDDIYTGVWPQKFSVDGDGGWWGGGNWTYNDTAATGVTRAFLGKFQSSDGKLIKTWHDASGIPWINADSELTALAVVGGNVYAAGRGCQGQGVVAKLDADLVHSGKTASVGGAAFSNCTVLSTVGAGGSRLLVGGSFSSGDATFGGDVRVAANNGANIFVAELNLAAADFSTGWVWARTTHSQTFQTPDNLELAGIGYHGATKRIYYGGNFGSSGGNNDLHFGDDETDLVLTNQGARSSFLSAFYDGDEGVEYLYMVRILIVSEIGGEFIQPGAGSNLYLVGDRVTVRAPARIYVLADDTNDVRVIYDLGQNEEGVEVYDIRHTCKGYTLDYGNYVETGTYYEFEASEPIRIEFKWDTDYKLLVQSQVTWPVPDDIAQEVLRTLGDPLPAAGAHWIRKATEVAPAVDGTTTPTDPNSYGFRYALDDYTLVTRTPPPDPGATTVWPDKSYSPAAFNKTTARVQIGDGIDRDYFLMLGPAILTLDWHKQVRIQLSSSSADTATLPFVEDLDAGVKTNNTAQSRELWYEYAAHVHIGADKDGTTTVDVKKPWTVGDGHFAGLRYNDLTVTGAEVYLDVPSLELPTAISWNFGTNLYYLTVPIGTFADLADAEDADGLPLNPADVNIEVEPVVRIVKSPAGTDTTNMSVWDDVGNRVFPLRPGMFYLDWQGADGTSLIMTLITAGFPGDDIHDLDPDVAAGTLFDVPDPDPRRRHLAGTPAVILDPSLTDAVAFLPTPFYFERGGEAAVISPDEGDVADTGNAGGTLADGQISQSGTFTCGRNGRSVMVFSYTDDANAAASGDLAREKLAVRVVETKTWNSANDWWDGSGQLLKIAGAQEIGLKIASPYDLAGLGTGYVLFDNAANYNAGIYNRDAHPTQFGPIIPVNRKYYPPDPADAPEPPNPPEPQLPVSEQLGDLLVAWYRADAVNPSPPLTLREEAILWPYRPVLYRLFDWPALAPTPDTPPTPDDSPRTRLRIVVASRLGSEGMDTEGNIQFSYDPDLHQNVHIYNQPDPAWPGYNPNEEHALIAPSYAHRDTAVRPATAYALRNDLNHTDFDDTYTSDPRVLVEYFDVAAQEFRMRVYDIELEDLAVSDERAVQSLDPDRRKNYAFRYWVKAGEPLFGPYPLDLVIGVNPCTAKAETGQPLHGTTYAEFGGQRTWFEDHRGQGWVASGARPGNEGNVGVLAQFFYPLRPEFWYDLDNDAYDWDGDGSLDGDFDDEATGDCVPWLPDTPRDPDLATRNAPRVIEFPSVWPPEVPILKAGETLTYSGGEYRADNSSAPGLPGVVGMAAVEVVYDDRNPNMAPYTDYSEAHYNWTVRVVSPLEERRVSLDPIPTAFEPAGGLVTVRGREYRFDGLSASLQRRIFYDSITKQLGMRGFLNDRTLGDSDLTASPPAAYLLEPNILTPAERDELLALTADLSGDFTEWNQAVGELFELTRNPLGVGLTGAPANLYLPGVEPYVDPVTGAVDDSWGQPFRGLGPGLAVIPNQKFLDPGFIAFDEVYVTLAENNDEALGASPVALHIFKVARKLRYRGAVMVVLSDNAFDEKAVLRHTGDFGTNTDELVYQWFMREEDGTEQPVPGVASPEPWEYFAKSGLGRYQVSLEGTGPIILRDNLVFMRYCHEEEINPDSSTDWAGTNWDEYYDDPDVADSPPGSGSDGRGEWAGAANSPLVDYEMRNGEVVELRTYRPQLVMGWVKRVLDAINPYEARIRDFYSNDSPATYTSMIQQFGPRYEGPVALNPDKDVIENHGLIELYQTVLDRAKSLSIDLSQPANTPGVANAILLAATRLALFYRMLGDEAYSDACDPTIGIGGEGGIDEANIETLHAFTNQVPTLLDEELALLRGVDDSYARPVYNRLFWNFTKEQGEASYALCYNVSDVNNDGFVDEDDAMKLWPQGHGDAWGHYLTAVTMHYDLLRHPYFNWPARSEFYNLMDVVLRVDYIDEQHFAEAAAAKARAGKDIVNLTYRAWYVDDPAGQWQGYKDTDEARAWGVTEWARRAGQGAFFDWVTANAILPAHSPADHEGIEQVDRTTVTDIRVISAQLQAIQAEYDDANQGINPVGVHPDMVPFDIDPTKLDAEYGPIETHFEQIYARATDALSNANRAFAFASTQGNRLRQLSNSAADHLREAIDQNLAYRGKLIEIFGTPYAGTIGAGKPFAAGYAGPDILLYMYVDKTRIDTDLGFLTTASVEWEAEIPQSIKEFEIDGTKFSDTYDDWLTDLPELVYDEDNPDGTLPYENGAGGKVILHLPLTAESYSFQAPAGWGQRASVGKLQQTIQEMVVAEAELQKSIKEYQIKVAGLNAMWENFAIKSGMGGDTLASKKLVGEFKFWHKTAEKTWDTIIRLLGYAKHDVMGFLDIAGEFSPDTVVVGLSNTVPVNELIMPVTKSVGFATNKAFTVMQEVGTIAKDLLDIAEARLELEEDFKSEKRDLNYELAQQLTALLTSLGDEKVEAIEVLKAAEELTKLAAQYRTTLDEGIRLLEERENWNKKLAAAIQRERYADMALRVHRNNALQKYHDAFAVAARYAYLAAKAYDYETNLPPGDPGSGVGLLTRIVRQRSLGPIEDDEPIAGRGGLAGALAEMRANYEVLKGQLGITNPEREINLFSLRTGLFRITGSLADNFVWQATLQQHRVANLWDVWEFRQYCRPFAAYNPSVPEPGIVIPFSTTIASRQNLFGWPLAPGDSAYDSSQYATKIRGLGVWFPGYNLHTLAATPRVYLVPVGTDILRVPTGDGVAVREWNLVNQRIPVPYPISESDLQDYNYVPAVDSLAGSFSDIVRHTRFRAYHDWGYPTEWGTLPYEYVSPSDIIDAATLEEMMGYSSSLVCRSVWNTRWLLIIPGAALLADPEEGIERFIRGSMMYGGDEVVRDGEGVNDIVLFLRTYSHGGM
ncbi:MAG: hypothetical protein BWZ02_00886 [Lentisphaerae bacterium ADurb.BinA184]|nr:MAG: hypothetical protein BWZ02_00886 [Lentisphaerae bacterium ADurb.BinA184]